MLKAKLFNIRLEHARSQKHENEPIEFDIAKVSVFSFLL